METTATTYRIRFDNDDEERGVTLETLKGRLCFRPEDREREFWERLTKYGYATLRGVQFFEDPYLCRGCAKVIVTDEDEEECPTCLAYPRCKNCGEKITDGSSKCICPDCAKDCAECGRTFTEKDPAFLLETESTAERYHAQCCGPHAMKILSECIYSEVEYRQMAVNAVQAYLATVQIDLNHARRCGSPK